MVLMVGSVKPMVWLFIVTDMVYGMTIFQFAEREIEDDGDESGFVSGGGEKDSRWRVVKEVKRWE